MKATGTGNQPGEHALYDASGTLSSAAPVLVLPRAMFRSHLIIQNTGQYPLYVDFGYARAGVATMSGTFPNLSVASVALTGAGANVGQGYSIAPDVVFEGGGGGDFPFGSTAYLGTTLPEELAPTNAATGHCVMSGTVPNQTVGSIVVDNGGSGYLRAPLVYLRNHRNDPYGCVATAVASAILLPVGSEPLTYNGTFCPTTPVVVASGNAAGGMYTCKYAT